jgi:nucleotide-binding universal stress UspA family protein
MTTFVVPLDGSAFAERALRPACAIAARLEHARVLLVQCEPDDVEVARRYLHDRASLYADVVDIDTRIVDSGDPAETILSIAATEADGMLCMATHGRGGLRATVLGSVSTKVVCGSVRPLVLVGPHCRNTLLPTERGRLLVCSDGSTSSNSVIPTASTWSDRLRLEPWLTEVVPPDENPEPAHEPHPNREVEAARVRLDALAAGFGTTPAHTDVLHGAPGRSIPWFAERLPAAMIAMATHGRSGLSRIAMGSVATDVVRHAPCPILLTRPTKDQAGVGG